MPKRLLIPCLDLMTSKFPCAKCSDCVRFYVNKVSRRTLLQKPVRLIQLKRNIDVS